MAVVQERVDGIAALGGIYSEMEAAHERIEYQEPLKAFLTVLERQHAEGFVGEEDPSGTSWHPLAPRTIKAKGHDRILRRTGRLRKSLVESGEGGDKIRRTTHRGLVYGSNVPYAIYHQLGGRNLPQRVHIGMSEKSLETLLDLIADHEVENLKAQHTNRR